LLIGIEACSEQIIGAAQPGARGAAHTGAVRKVSLQSNKNDFIDAEAVTRENMRLVLIKTDEQLDSQPLHRVHDRLAHHPTALIDQIRATRRLRSGERRADHLATRMLLARDRNGNNLRSKSALPATGPHGLAICSPV
jgi:hypothetical protein